MLLRRKPSGVSLQILLPHLKLNNYIFFFILSSCLFRHNFIILASGQFLSSGQDSTKKTCNIFYGYDKAKPIER